MSESPDPVPKPPSSGSIDRSDDGSFLTPRMRLYLYFTAGVFLTLWVSLEILGAAGFVAFVVGMILAQLAWKLRPHLNTAFAVGLAAYLITLVVWSFAIGPPQPTKRNQTPTVIATEQSG